MIDAFSLTPWQSPGYLEERQGRLHMEGTDLTEVAEGRPTPLFIFSEERLRHNARRIKNAFESLHPRVNVSYASKACSNVAIMQILREEGVSVEVNSGGEFFKAITAGFRPDQISFNGVSKTDEELIETITAGVGMINVDSLFELGRIIAVAGKLGKRPDLSLRIVPEIIGGTTAGCETGSATSKFGILQSEVDEALEVALANPAAVRVTGLHLHIGSQVSSLTAYEEAAAFLAAYAVKIKERLPTLSLVNMGGGFPIEYVKYSDPASGAGYFNTGMTVEEVARATVPVLAKALGEEMEIWVEPGRSMVGDAAVMLTRVESEKVRGGVRWLGLDAGYHTLNDIHSYTWYFHAVNATRADDGETEKVRLFGPLCDSGDAWFHVDGEAKLKGFLAEHPEMAAHRDKLEALLVGLPPFRELPAATGVGDLLCFLDAGGYSLDQLYAINGRVRPEVLLLESDGGVRTIRRADSRAELLLNEIF